MTISILYVCTYWGVRSQIAKLLTDQLALPELRVESAGFEAGVIGKLPRQVLERRGLDLPSTSPPTLFNFARTVGDFDYVVTLCNRGTQENYRVLYEVVEKLFQPDSEIVHWDVPDFMAIAAEKPEDRFEAAEAIVGVIEEKVVEFVSTLRAVTA